MKKSNGKLYWYGVQGEVLAESDLSGTILYEYVYFNGKRIARRTPAGTVHYFLADRLGSARVMTNATGGVVEKSDFYPYGGERVITNTLDNNYKFTGPHSIVSCFATLSEWFLHSRLFAGQLASEHP